MMTKPERLQKAMATAGIASRRECERIIQAGRVTVNGTTVDSVGSVVLPNDIICVDGVAIRNTTHHLYIMLNKPSGVVSTVNDPQGRATILDIVAINERVYPVGRLDANSEGLLLITNDGALTHHLTHPRFEIEKEYHVFLTPTPTQNALDMWSKGVKLNGTRTAPAQVSIIDRTPHGTWVCVVMHEGRKRQIREVAELLGYTTKRLIRVREGHLMLGSLKTGTWRYLRDDEIEPLLAHTTR